MSAISLETQLTFQLPYRMLELRRRIIKRKPNGTLKGIFMVVIAATHYYVSVLKTVIFRRSFCARIRIYIIPNRTVFAQIYPYNDMTWKTKFSELITFSRMYPQKIRVLFSKTHLRILTVL